MLRLVVVYMCITFTQVKEKRNQHENERGHESTNNFIIFGMVTTSTSFLCSFSKRAVKRFEIIGIPLLCNGIIIIRL